MTGRNTKKKKEELLQSLKEENGMMVVEATLTFPVFIIVCFAVVFLINIFTVHNKIQFAINSAAKEMASCTYIGEVLGLRSAVQTWASDGQPYMKDIDDTTNQVVDSLNQIQKLYSSGQAALGNLSDFELNTASVSTVKSSFSSLKDEAGVTLCSVKASASSIKNLFSDSNGLIAGMIYMAVDGASYAIRSVSGSAIAAGLTKHYLIQEEKSADDYLNSYHIKNGYAGLDFSGSTLLCDENMRIIDIVVEYDINLSFLQLVLPNSSLHMVQRVSVAAWVGGDDKKVSSYLSE